MSWPPGLEATPAEAMITLGTCHMQTALVFLYLSLAARAMLRNEFSQVLALCFACHSLVVPIVIHPLRHVAAASRIMGLWEVAVEAGYPGALGTGCLVTEPVFKEDLIAALRVGAPRQVGATFNVASEEGFFILGYNLLGGNNGIDERCGGLCTALGNGTGAAEDHVLFNASREILVPAGLAAVMHAAEGRWLLSGTQLVHTDWAVGSRAWRALGIFHFKPRGDEQ